MSVLPSQKNISKWSADQWLDHCGLGRWKDITKRVCNLTSTVVTHRLRIYKVGGSNPTQAENLSCLLRVTPVAGTHSEGLGLTPADV